MFTYHDQFRKELAIAIAPIIEKTFSIIFPWEKAYGLFGATPSKEAGDLAFPLFQIAKEAKTNPAQAAKSLEAAFTELPKFITEKKAMGPYLNFFFNFDAIASKIIPSILSGDMFKQKLTENTPKTMIEYSQPNTHKEMHVGHMRNLCLGDALIRLHRYSGFDIVASTFPGDVGTHVAKCLWYLKFHYKGEIPKTKKGAWLGTLYTAGHNKLEDERGTEKEASNREQLTAILKQLEQKSGEYYDLWKETREWSIELMNEVYTWANVKFDVWYWESEVDSASVKLAREYQQKGLFVEDQGAVGVNLEDYKLGFCMLLKSDGNGLYATKDIELARRKFQDYHIEKNIYVVDKRQEHHFKQVFKVLELMGFENAKKCFHLQYDFVELPDGAMSSRKGNIVPLQALIENMVKMIKEQYLNRYVNEWSPEQIESTAQIVAKGAIKYGMTRIDPGKKIVFDMQEWLKLDGESGPYIQYAYARINSMVNKLGAPTSNEIHATAPQEKDLVAQLMNFHQVVEQATLQYKPSALTGYLYDLSRAYNSFYAECPVGSAPEPVRSSRLMLSKATALTLKQGLALLGIEAPEKM
ncbi:arginine--tRNA ligase [Peredibacter starrii]|uniref:Arginine--tRNA ligase n=1 Tax=Peredibacter starrii TaxID=28202 RepID=A0AAX4HK37_9BACT|nr:arginine--tRNA ligase [Peredibacter starrii]WPU63369.1 arginine--tRNA ligase [Peredibacter starrii]